VLTTPERICVKHRLAYARTPVRRSARAQTPHGFSNRIFSKRNCEGATAGTPITLTAMRIGSRAWGASPGRVASALRGVASALARSEVTHDESTIGS
jgi:hypothetical protein